MVTVKWIKRIFWTVSLVGAIANLLMSHWRSSVVSVEMRAATMNPRMLGSSAENTSKTSSWKTGSFLVKTPACRIPDLDPFDSSIGKFVRLRGRILCYGKPSVTFEDGNVLRINWTSVKIHYDGDLDHCKYQPIIRGDDFKFTYGPFQESFSKDVEISDEFIRIYCVSKSGGTINTNFHSLIVPKDGVEQRCEKDFKEHITTNKPEETLNVLMIGVDSISRLNFMRQMPLTRNYLLKDLEAIEMVGYTKVADNTFVNIAPMTAGKFVNELPWNETMNTSFDKYNFIWNDFSRSGYRTLYAEDAPKIAIFTYLKPGFQTPPADHYNRVFSVAMEKHKSVWNHDHHCVGDRLETDMILKYVYDFEILYRKKPHFGFAFITRLSHDHVNDAGAADDPHFRFLKRIHNEGLLNNTVLLYFSDHGNRYGDIRSTYVGKLEERLPFLFFVFPKWFKAKYPRLIQNLAINSNRLTTPFDVYETLRDILYFKGNSKISSVFERGISLFSEVSENRSCEHAAILSHWCMCLETEQLSTSSERANQVAHFILSYINEQLLDSRGMCAVLQVAKITEFTKAVANNKVLHFRESLHDVINRTVTYGNRTHAVVVYQITMITSPGEGLFEATVNFHEAQERFSLAGDISRINRYGSQSHCIDLLKIKKYCFCERIPDT